MIPLLFLNSTSLLPQVLCPFSVVSGLIKLFTMCFSGISYWRPEESHCASSFKKIISVGGQVENDGYDNNKSGDVANVD